MSTYLPPRKLLNLGDDQEECVIDHNFDVISQLEGTKIREIVVWHGVEALGISPGFQVLAFHPAKKVTFIKSSADRWMAKLGCNGEPVGEQLNASGWKFVKCLCTFD